MRDEPSQPAIVIRPMGIGEVLDTGFSLARANFRFLVSLTAWGVVPGLALSAVGLALLAGFNEISITATLTLSGLLGNVLTAFGSSLAFFAVQNAVAKLIDPNASSVPLHAFALYRAGFGRMFLWGLFVLVMVVPAMFLLVLFPLAIYLGVRVSVFFVPFIVERHGPFAAMKRSWALTSKSWWHTAGIVAIMLIVVSMLQGALGLSITVLGLIISGVSGAGLTVFFSSLAQSITALLFTPVMVCIQTVLYYELRARNEGFDLQQRARALSNPVD